VGAPQEHPVTVGPRWVVHAGHSAESLAAECAWLESAPLSPLQQRSCWPSRERGERWHLLTVHDGDGQAIASLGMRDAPSRSMPGFRILRVYKFGLGVAPEFIGPLLLALRDYARSQLRVLRVHVEAFMLGAEQLDTLAATAVAAGFSRLPFPREYEHTLIVDLSGSEAEMTGRFHRMVMKNVRKSERAGHVVAPITDARFAERLAQLLDETMGRTGARAERLDWLAILAATRSHPDRFRLTGLFLNGDLSPASLGAFRFCGCAGDGAADLLAASTRRRGPSGGVPMMPAILLDTFTWARSQGARWFDFGGVVTEGDPRYAQLGSIAEFKRLFGQDVRRVGVDLLFVPRPLLSGAAEVMSRLAHRFRLR
jgi:hypothetical protein